VGPEQHHAFDPVAIQLIERGAETLQNRIIGGPDGHWSFSIHSTYNVKRRMICTGVHQLDHDLRHFAKPAN